MLDDTQDNTPSADGDERAGIHVGGSAPDADAPSSTNINIYNNNLNNLTDTAGATEDLGNNNLGTPNNNPQEDKTKVAQKSGKIVKIGKIVVSAGVGSQNNNLKIPSDNPKHFRSADDLADSPPIERFHDEIPWITTGGITVLSAPEKVGKTALTYAVMRRSLKDNPSTLIIMVSEIQTAASRHLQAILTEEELSRVRLAPAHVVGKECLGELFKWMRQTKNANILLAVDTLAVMLGAWGIDLNSNKDTGDFFSQLKRMKGKLAATGGCLSTLLLHHKGRPDREGKPPKEGMGATAIFSQSHTVANLDVDKNAQISFVSWRSQVIDSGEQAIKFTGSVVSEERTIFTDFEIVDAESPERENKSTKDLELMSLVMAFMFAAVEGKISSENTVTALMRATGWDHRRANRILYMLCDAGYLTKRQGVRAKVHYSISPDLLRIIGWEDRINYMRQELGLRKGNYAIVNGKDGHSKVVRV